MNEMSLNLFLTILTILSGLITWFGFKMAKKANKKIEELDRYKFKNRTSGGVVQYETYEKAEAHKDAEQRNGCLSNIGSTLTIFSGLLFFGLLIMWGFQAYNMAKHKLRTEDPNDPLTEWRKEAEKRRDSIKKVIEAKKDREKKE